MISMIWEYAVWEPSEYLAIHTQKEIRRISQPEHATYRKR
ncbi:hypothetical protein Tco_1116448, partial [Tanacetum coccineum]